MEPSLAVYLPQDRARALALGAVLPAQALGAALFADLSGFTPLTEALDRALGPRRGSEAVTDQINQVFAALIAEVERYAGSVLGFAGDAITCWFDETDGGAAMRAAACALALQHAMVAFSSIALPDGGSATLSLKVAVASGPARRLLVGDPTVQLLDALAGATLDRVAAGEHLARPGEVLVDAATVAALGEGFAIAAWRDNPEGNARFAVIDPFAPLPPATGPRAPIGALAPEDLRPWLLPAVYARYQAGLGAFLTELRPVVVLFLRFAGIDYDGDPEAGVRLDGFVRRVQAILARYDGTLLQLTIGDKGSFLYAAFGAPASHVDDYQTVIAFAPDAEAQAHRAGTPILAARFAGTLAPLLALYGDGGGANARAEEGLRLAREAGDRQVEGYVLHWYGVVASMEGDYARAREIFEQGIAVSRACGDARQVAVTQVWYGQMLGEVGEFAPARQCVEEALAFHELTGDSVNIGWALGMSGVILCYQGDFRGAKVALEQALTVVRSNENVFIEGRVLQVLGRVTLELHELVAARAYLQDALAIILALQDQVGEAYILADLCRTAASLGDFKTAREAAARSSELCELRGDHKAGAHALLSHALLALWEEDYATAGQRAAGVLGAARSAPYPPLEPPALILLGYAALGQGLARDAAVAFRAALDLRHEGGYLHTLAEPLAGLALALLAEGDHAAALVQAEAALAHLRADGTAAGAQDPLRIWRACHEVLVAAGDPRADAVLADAYGQVQKLATQIVGEDTRRLLEQAPHHRAILAAWEARSA